MSIRDNPSNILGFDSSDNQFASTNVAANADGSIIERIEYLQTLVAALTAGSVILNGVVDAAINSTTIFTSANLTGYGDDFFNNQFYAQVLHNDNNAGGAPEAETRKITDYTSSTGSFTCDAFSSAVQASDLIVILHESQVGIGSNNANNIYDSSSVAANDDGSVLERLESIKDKIDTVDNFIDTEVGAIAADVTLIKGYVGGTDSAANFIGANNNNNTVNTDQVAANVDGSILERLEDLKDRIDAVDNYVDSEVAAIKAKTDNLPADPADASDITTSFATTDGKIDAIQTDLGNPSARTNLQTLQAMLGNPDVAAQSIWDALCGTGGIATFPAGTAAANDVSIAEVLRYIQESVSKGSGTAIANDKSLVDALGTNGSTVTDSAVSVLGAIGANNADNAFDSSTVAANADGSVLERLEAIKDQVTAVDDYVDTEITTLTSFAAAGGNGTAVVRKTVTFTNQAADVNLFTVTGAVIAKIIAICDTNVESAGGCNIGVDAGGVAIIADTDCTSLEAGDIWHDNTPDSSVEALTVLKEYIVANGTTILLDVEAAKQVDSGAITFVCFYTAVSSNGAVVAA